MTELLVIGLSGLLLYSLSQGAPYVPTMRRGAQSAIKLMSLPAGSLVVDIGAGDGRVVRQLAAAGYRAVGVELNPVLWLIGWLVSWRQPSARLVLGNVWRWHLPAETAGVFVFTADAFTERLEAWLEAEQRRLKRPLTVVTYGAQLRRHQPLSLADGCSLYRLEA